MDSGNSRNATGAVILSDSGDLSNKFVTNLCIFIFCILFACELVHFALRHLGQPRIISELLVGFIVGNIPFLKGFMHDRIQKKFQVIEGLLSALYMFVLGLEMDSLAILRPQGPEAKIALAGIASTGGVYIIIYTAIHLPKRGLDFFKDLLGEKVRVLAAFLVMLSATSSPIVTRLITKLKLSQTDIGRTAIRAGLASDLVCTILMCILIALRESWMEFFGIFAIVVIEMLMVRFVMRLLFDWVNHRNPEGKPFKGLDMIIIVLTTQFLCHSAKFFKYDTKMNSFLVGLMLPRQGRVSNFLISKINYILMTFILPLYLSMAGIEARFKDEEGHLMPGWGMMAAATGIATITKILGTLVFCLRHGLHWLEAITLGVILSMKGYYQIFFSMHAVNRKLMNGSDFMVIVDGVMLSIAYVPFTVSFIIRKVRKIKVGKAKLMGLQWYNPTSQLSIIVGLQRVENITASLNLIEMMAEGSEEGILLYATDMIELTEQNKAALVYRQGTNSLMVADDSVIKFREQIGKSLDEHMEFSSNNGEKGRGNIMLKRNLAISSFSDMHDDICCSAQDSMAVLIVLPFHKSQSSDGGMDIGHAGFRTVNKNVLQHAPCSVGILIDRGLGRNKKLSSTSDALSLMHVVVFFIGGADDREALACAAIIADHPAIHLLVIRIISDTETMATDGLRRHVIAAMPDREIEMEVDNEYFAGFYEHYITNGRVKYMEMHVKNGAEAVRMMRELDGEYQLFIVGQGSERNSTLTAGMSEWAECPELGPIGDILASSDFPLNVSVLVIHQQNPARHSQYISKRI